MKDLRRYDRDRRERKAARKDETVTNFMGGESFRVNPLETMKMVTASSIFGEASFYREGGIGNKVIDAFYNNHPLLKGCTILPNGDGKRTTEIMEEVIDKALDYDFKGTLDWAVTLRKEYYMRLNPQVIMVRAAVHPKRKEFTGKYPGEFKRIEQLVMSRADEPATQVAYFLYINEGKRNFPTILKKSLKEKLEKLNRYQVAKYKNHEIGMINTVRIIHASSDVLDELMRTGNVQVAEDERTWENMRSKGATWEQIIKSGCMGHMAMLRNLRNVFQNVTDTIICDEYLKQLKEGVIKGKQFPYRYYSAMKEIEKAGIRFREPQILDTLEECMDISMENMPRLSGRTMALSDNSGSAWGSITSEYGSVKIAEIDNLSAVIAAAASEEGYVGKFGDKLITYPIMKRRGILSQAQRISEGRDRNVGGSTEGGIWEFFWNAILKKEWWDNIFIYSDQQAGHGGLYGTSTQMNLYKANGFGCSYSQSYINVFDLIREYRKRVNPKVNVFSVQTAGYNNVCVPENAYRTSILYGWTGKEIHYADIINHLWDEVEGQTKVA